MASNKEHILLTSLGTRVFEGTIYKWNGEVATADLAPLALIELFKKLDLSIPNRFVAVVTKDAKDTTWPVFRDWVSNNYEVKPELISIDDGRDSDEIRKILESVANPEYIQEGAELTLDVTQGFRHFPFIFYALVLYLKSLRGVNIRGVYYGMAEGIPPTDPKPIIDLQPLVELPEWFYAVRMFRDQGTTQPMADLLQPLAETLTRKKGDLYRNKKPKAAKQLEEKAKQVQNSVDSLKSYAFAYESALPLELEKASRELIDSIQELPSIDSPTLPPLVDELTKGIVNAAKESAFEKSVRKGDWKQNTPLDKNELERQACMIDLYLERGQISLAVGLMREWVVSWAIWKSEKSEECEDWLSNKVRSRYESILGAIGASARSENLRFTMTPEQKEFRDFWNQLTNNLRNALHHHAMRPEALEQVPRSPMKNVQNFWNQLKINGLKTEDSITLPPLGGRLLISPQGLRPGVLFSALKVADPDTCLVICSDISADSTRDAAREAGFKGHIEQIKLEDPLGGFSEIDIVAESAHDYLSYADEVRANITGGTTLMGVIVQRLVEDAQELSRPVRRFALIDRRPQEEQDSDPFEVGEPHWLDN